jgi:uncharacterized protein YbjT (DUF2867 family)
LTSHHSPSSATTSRTVLITGATGYLGRALIPQLLARGHQVRALIRANSRARIESVGRDGTPLPSSLEIAIGDALNPADVARALPGIDTVVHLVGVPKPSPAKAQQFRDIDLVSIKATVEAVAAANPRPHLIYLSVAQPASVMRAYVAVRAQGESLIRARRLHATFVRPWYVLGPGHRWPYLFIPIYALLRLIPATRPSAERLGLVTLSQMIGTLVHAVENPSNDISIIDVPGIRRLGTAKG